MASLEFIDFHPMREVIAGSDVIWGPDPYTGRISKLPQIFWGDGTGWAEANYWALDKTSAVKLETVEPLMKHLHAYAVWLEGSQMDWRHFPVRADERVLTRFRGELIRAMELGSLTPSTCSQRMRALIQFYRFCEVNNFVGPRAGMWSDRSVVISYYDTAGFKRAISRVTTNLSIPNRTRKGIWLEDGLLPVSENDMQRLLRFTNESENEELHFMLTLGFFTGARAGSIATLGVTNIEKAVLDPSIAGFYNVPVGPGTGVATKFSVKGSILVPDFLIHALKAYAYSVRRLKRQDRAKPEHRSTLFLTRRGNPYSNSTLRREMTDLRRNAQIAGLKFMQSFKFHQTRATYGTWLMTLALQVTTPAAAIAFVRDAMLHKDEAITWRYIRFLEHSKAKQKVADEFSRAFTGIGQRNWDLYDK